MSATLPRAETRAPEPTRRGGAPPAAGDRPLWVGAALLLIAHAALAWAMRVPSITTGNDDAVYLLLARSLREGGYNDVFHVGAPFHSQYPPLYPALLAIVGALAGERLGVMIAVNIVLSAAALALTFDAARRIARWPALLALAILALSPPLLRAAATISSEPLLTLCAAVALHLLARPAPSRRARIAAGAAAIAGALARSAGVPLVSAVGLHWLLQRRWRDALLLGVAAALTVGAWLTWTVVTPTKFVGRSYIADAVLAPTGRFPSARPPEVALPPEAEDALREAAAAPPPAAAGSRGDDEPMAAARRDPAHGALEVVARRVAANVPGYLARRLPSSLAVPTVSGTALDNAAWLLVTIVLGGAGLWVLWRRWRVAALWVLGTAALLAVWPYSLSRFLIPILPPVVAALMLGAGAVGARLHRRLAVAIPLLVALPLLAGAATLDAERVRGALACDRAAPLGSPGCFDANQRAFFEAAAYVRHALPADAIVLSAKEGAFYYLTGRRVAQLLGAVGLGTPALRDYLREQGAGYILLSRLKRDEWLLARPLLGMCTELTLVRAWDPAPLLLRVEPPPPARRGEACRALARYAVSEW